MSTQLHRPDERYLIRAVADAIEGVRGVSGLRIVRPKKGRSGHPKARIKSRGRLGAAVRFYVGEKLRDHVSADPLIDRQTARKGAPRGNRRGTGSSCKPFIHKRFLRPRVSPVADTYRAPTRSERMSDHRLKMAMKAARR